MDQAVVHGVRLIEENDMVVRADRERADGFEPRSMRTWQNACSNGGTAIDIGAYTGVYAIAAERAGAECVEAFEPNTVSRSRLEDNLQVNHARRVAVHGTALGARKGRGVLRSERPMSSAARLSGTMPCVQNVRIVALDSMNFADVRAIKIDVEGAEVDVLRGALLTLARGMPELLVECLMGSDEVQRLLYPLGYFCAPLDPTMYWFCPEDKL